MINWKLKVPFGYETRYVTLEWLNGWLLAHHHPEYVRRLVAWLNYKQGSIGVGSGWRDDGTQPDKPGFAPEGQSFHQNQRYDDGFIGACAVDLVVPDGPDDNNWHDGVTWAMTIPQGSYDAYKWGLHCNVGFPPTGEPWHMQPIEIDGHASWLLNGSPAPKAGYQLPGDNEVITVDKLTFQKKRLLDTRELGGRTAQGGQIITLKAPIGAKAVKVNLTAVQSVGSGHITAYPAETKVPDTSDLNYHDSRAIANQVDVPVNSGGMFSLYVTTPVHVIVDQVGYWL